VRALGRRVATLEARARGAEARRFGRFLADELRVSMEEFWAGCERLVAEEAELRADGYTDCQLRQRRVDRAGMSADEWQAELARTLRRFRERDAGRSM
jgi:hypothetical protein